MEYSDRVLDETPERVTRFIIGIGAVPEIFTLLNQQGGMTVEDVNEGKDLLLSCLALPAAISSGKDTDEAQAQRAATAELDSWDEPNFARAQATLDRHYPSAATYVFHNLSASQGPAAVQGVATFLARVEALEKGTDPARAASKADDKKAVILLGKRGFTPTERSRLSDLVSVALGTATTVTPANETVNTNRREALSSLKAWFDEWSTAARAVIKKRAHLIRLGLAERRSPKSPEPDPTETK